MKKISVSLLLTVTFIATSCMEQQRKYEYCDEIPLATLNNYYQNQFCLMPPLHGSYVYTTPGYHETEAQWEQYNPSTTTHTTFTRPIIIKPDQKIMQKLYADAFQFFKNNTAESLQGAYYRFNIVQCRQITSSTSINRKLAHLIYATNNAKKENINENIMEQFAYTQQNVDNKQSIYATLFFNLLKKYNITT